MLVRESIEFKRGIDPKDALKVGNKELYKEDLDLMMKHFQEAFSEFPILKLTFFEYTHRHRFDPKIRLRIMMPAGVDDKTGYNYNITDWFKMKQWLKTRIRTWFEKNTPYKIQRTMKGSAQVLKDSPTEFAMSQDIFLEDK